MEKNQSAPASASARSQSGRSPAAREKKDAAPLTATADQAVQSFAALYQQIQDTLRTQVERSPYMALGAAAGVGFIVGGGLASPLGHLLLRSSVRAFGPPLLQAALNATTNAAGDSGSRDADS